MCTAHCPRPFNATLHHDSLKVVRSRKEEAGDEIGRFGSLAKGPAVCACGLLFVADIAEGLKKRGKADKLHFFNIAQGAIEESRYYLILARDLDYGNIVELSQLLEEVSKLMESCSQAILNSDFLILST